MFGQTLNYRPILSYEKTKREADRSAALCLTWVELLQVGHRGQVGRQLGGEPGVAPVGAERGGPGTRVDRGHEGRACVGGCEIAGEGVAACLGQVGVGIAKVEREDLVG